MLTIVSKRQGSNRKVSDPGPQGLGGATLADIVQIIATATHETPTSELRRMLAAAGVSMDAFKRQNAKESDYRLRARPIKKPDGRVEWHWSIGWQRPKDPRRKRPRCSVKGCDLAVHARGWCQYHYDHSPAKCAVSPANYAGPGLK